MAAGWAVGFVRSSEFVQVAVQRDVLQPELHYLACGVSGQFRVTDRSEEFDGGCSAVYFQRFLPSLGFEPFSFPFLLKLFPSVVHLMLTYGEHTLSSEWHTDANITQWCEVLRSFNNVKTLHVPNGLTKGLSGSLAVHDGLGESPMELLPELEELRYDASGSVGWAFEQFLDVRRKGGRPFTLVPIIPTRGDTSSRMRALSAPQPVRAVRRRSLLKAQPGLE